MNDFCHLHVHTEYSQLDGMGTCNQYAERAKKLGFKYLGITDHGNIDGLIKFQNACKKNDIKPILGCELYLVNNLEEKNKKRGHVCVWIKNETGFKNLCKMVTYSNIKGFYYKPRIDFDYFYKHCDGLCVSTACLISFVKVFEKSGEKFFRKLKRKLGDDLYLEVMPHKLDKQLSWNREVAALSAINSCKIIATNDCHYVKKRDYKAQDVLLAIQRKTTIDNKKRFRFTIKELHLKTAKEMQNTFEKNGHPFEKAFLSNTIEIAKKCSNFTIPKQDINLPRVPGVPVNPIKARIFLLNLCHNGYRDKFGKNIENNKIYNDRLNEEFNLIIKKKFERYFFIVWETINWCKKNDILVGPGRGSVGGSLIAYLLGITSVDPIKHQLIFDRFINKDRIDYPDIDIDFEDQKRHLVREHLESIYGKDKVAGVSSFGRMKAKAVMKDVGRAFGVHWSETESFTKLIDETPNQENKIQEAIDNYPECKKYAKQYPKVVKYAKQLEGQVRGYGQHAAALVISKEPIGTSGRCSLRMQEGLSIINWEKDDTEYVGLMKLDALALKLLSILSEARRLIKINTGENIDFEKIDLDDKHVLKDIDKGYTVGVFQLGTYAMTSLIEEMGIGEFDHIAASVALVRPGPTNSGMTKEYIRRKHGGNWEPMHEIYEEITRDTYGVIVYQEQVMKVISEVAGLPYSTADKVRKIIGKKRDRKEFAQYREMFIDGCNNTGYFTLKEAEDFWDGLEEHARYSFNRAHSVEYSILAYWCSWLKHYYPVEFICSSLSYGAEKKKKDIIEEAYKLGLSIMLPKVGISDAEKWIAKNNKLYIPFIEVKGIGEVKASEASLGINQNKSNGGKNIRKFFRKNKEENNKFKKIDGKFGELLDSFSAYDEKNPEITPEIRSLFSFRIVTNPSIEYKKLYDLFDQKISKKDLDGLLSGDKIITKYTNNGALIHPYRIPKNKWNKLSEKIRTCDKCDLIKQCKAPVLPSTSKYPVMIIGEAPGPDEDINRIGFIGRSGDFVWSKLKPFERKNFHVTNINKCFPKTSKKPNSEQIKICTNNILLDEINLIKPILILSFGNTGLQFFRDQKSGITEMSGKTIWNERFGAWVVYCMHPAATLHNSDNKEYFNVGIKRFKTMLNILKFKPY